MFGILKFIEKPYTGNKRNYTLVKIIEISDN